MRSRYAFMLALLVGIGAYALVRRAPTPTPAVSPAPTLQPAVSPNENRDVPQPAAKPDTYISPQLRFDEASESKLMYKNFEFDMRYPRLVHADGVDSESVRTFNSLAEKVAREGSQWINDLTRREKEMGGFMSVGYEITFATPELISVEFEECSICCRAGTAGCSVRVLNYDPQRRKQLEPSDLFKPRSGHARALMNYCEPILRERYHGAFLDLRSKRERLGMYDRIGVSPAGLLINFDEYEVGAGSDGTPQLLVPYDVIRDKLNPRSPVAALADRAAHTD